MYIFSGDVTLIFSQPFPALGRTVVEQVKSWWIQGHRDAVLANPLHLPTAALQMRLTGREDITDPGDKEGEATA